MQNILVTHVRQFKALSDENRLAVLRMLKDGERCACKLQEELNIGQSTLSHHMKILCDCGIVKCRKEGKWSHYSINKEGCQLAQDFLDEIMDASEDAAECANC